MQSDRPFLGSRWSVVFGGFLLALMGGLSYSWGVFVEPMGKSFGWSKAATMLPLSVFMVVFAIVMIPAGRLQEKLGTRRIIVLGAFLFLIANLMSSLITRMPNLGWLVLSYGIIGGIACGLTYSCVAPSIRRWFPDYPGLAVSLGVMGFGIASFIFAPLKAHIIIPQLGLDGTFIIIALLTFGVTLIASRLVVFPTDKWYMHIYGAMHLPNKTGMVRSNLKPGQMVKKPLFWMIWASFLFIVYGSLLIIGILPSYGEEVAKLSGSKAAIPISLFALFNGLSRPMAGFISDRIGIPRVMMFVFTCQALVFLIFPYYVVSFVAMNIAAVILGFGIGTALALYPVLTSECFGVEHLGVNYGIVFSAYGFGAIAIQGGAYLRDLTGSYTVPLLIAGILSLLSTVIVILIRHVYKLS
ncbi:MAG: OFA family MFS transporter [Candidatus Cloacimonadaceae bacterium]|nr:OFA family MFS transporter [Candidatus Cloacimonadaceae bacterium]